MSMREAVAENDKFDELEWQLKLQTEPIDFKAIEEELGFSVNPQIKEYLSTYWFLPF